MKTYYYVGIAHGRCSTSPPPTPTKVHFVEAENKKYLNKKIDWERFNDREKALKHYHELKKMWE